MCYGFALTDIQVTYLGFIGGEDENDTICKAMGAVIVPSCITGMAKKGRRNLQLAIVVH